MQTLKKLFFVLVITGFALSACQTASSQMGFQPQKVADMESNKTPLEPQIIPTNLPPSPTPHLIQVTATVFSNLPAAPMLMYHRFHPDPGRPSEKYQVSLSDLDNQLHALYEAGYTLIALDQWLRGEISIPEGRRPLIITIDDLFYADQLSLDENGNPANYSGVGRIWQFYQDHPDFNFHLALFYNLGDKGYANRYKNGSFYIEEGWEKDRAEAIAWGIQNGAIPYNHFFDHPNLSGLSPDQILWQLQENDAALREALILVGQSDLSEKLPNILALPYVIWPETDAGKQVLFDYQSPEGSPVSAILEANDGAHVRPLPAPFSETFDPYHIKRLNATQEAVDAIVLKAKELPTAEKCNLGEIPAEDLTNPAQIRLAILSQIRQGNCNNGYYTVEQLAFYVDHSNIIQLSP